MKFYMVTAFGVSTEYNQHSVENPSYGIGQGATDGPPGWTQISDVIIKSHNQTAYGSILQDPIKTIKVKRSIDMFVDDASLIVNATKPTLPAETIMEQTQNDISSWAKFLWISGGLLELTKTKYYMLIWKFNSIGAPSLWTEDEQPSNTLQVYDQQGQPATIERILQNKALTMLGVRKTGDLKESDELTHLLAKTEKFTQRT
jgi:hypothetical protein